MGKATLMNDRIPVAMDDRAERFGRPRTFSRMAGCTLLTVFIAGTGILVATEVLAQNFGGQRPQPRDTPAQTGSSADASSVAMISGRVVDGQTGQALSRARVVATAREAGGRRHAAQTDRSGRYVLSDLAAGRFTVTVSKPGYVTLSYGQRRPRQPSTPVQVIAGEHLENLDLALPSGSVITGQVMDEEGAALPLAVVRVLRYVYQQGQQRLVPVGTDRTDDRGQYRVFGLDPGDYLVSASVPRRRLNPTGGRIGAFGPAGAGFALAGLGDAAQDGGPVGYAPSYYPGVTNLSEASRVTAGLSAEVGGVDFAVRLVPTATVRGIVFQPDGTPATGVQVMLLRDDGVPARDSTLVARVQDGGTFMIRLDA